MHLYICACLVCAAACRGEERRHWMPWNWNCYPVWVLDSELKSSGGTASTQNHWVISPSPQCDFYLGLVSSCCRGYQEDFSSLVSLHLQKQKECWRALSPWRLNCAPRTVLEIWLENHIPALQASRTMRKDFVLILWDSWSVVVCYSRSPNLILYLLNLVFLNLVISLVKVLCFIPSSSYSLIHSFTHLIVPILTHPVYSLIYPRIHQSIFPLVHLPINPSLFTDPLPKCHTHWTYKDTLLESLCKWSHTMHILKKINRYA